MAMCVLKEATDDIVELRLNVKMGQSHSDAKTSSSTDAAAAAAAEASAAGWYHIELVDRRRH